ncbi:unnamed protein product [Rotaria sp. Silwood2]|nr:unnamed protein product [Rotaria sp. Silwood2]
MEDTTRLTNEHSIKLFIQRDYTEGTTVKFQERFPPELQGKIDSSKFIDIIRHINSIYAEAESLSCKTFMENCCACLTGYLLLLCMPTHYEKEMELKSVGKLGMVKRKQFLQKRDISRSHEVKQCLPIILYI